MSSFYFDPSRTLCEKTQPLGCSSNIRFRSRCRHGHRYRLCLSSKRLNVEGNWWSLRERSLPLSILRGRDTALGTGHLLLPCLLQDYDLRLLYHLDMRLRHRLSLWLAFSARNEVNYNRQDNHCKNRCKDNHKYERTILTWLIFLLTTTIDCTIPKYSPASS